MIRWVDGTVRKSCPSGDHSGIVPPALETLDHHSIEMELSIPQKSKRTVASGDTRVRSLGTTTPDISEESAAGHAAVSGVSHERA
jgi:hypothetical protein